LPASRNDAPPTGPASASFERIKQGFDPAFCYVVFECGAGPVGESRLEAVSESLQRLGLAVSGAKMFHDAAAEKVMLVVQFEPAQRLRIMEEIFNAGLPEEVALYAYGSSKVDVEPA
jgi:hypothetical protein